VDIFITQSHWHDGPFWDMDIHNMRVLHKDICCSAQSHDSLGISEGLIGEKVWYLVYSTVKSDDNYTQQHIELYTVDDSTIRLDAEVPWKTICI
jgi:hypothetical protein